MIEIDQKQSLNHIEIEEEEATMQQLRSKATEFLLTEKWNESIQAYTQFITLCHEKESNPNSKYRKPLCLALSNRAEARLRLKEYDEALKDCEEALLIDSSHFKTLVCKGNILVNLNKYSLGLDCFKNALLVCDSSNGNLDMLNGLIEKCKKLNYVSKTGNFDVSDWITSGFNGKCPELGEFVGCVEIKRSEISGRGLFSTKNVDVGSLILVTKSVATERCILPNKGNFGETAQLIMWENFIAKVNESATKCLKTRHLIGLLSTGENEDDLEIPEISEFKAESLGGKDIDSKKVEMEKILSVLDVNSLVEDAVSAKVLGKNRDYYGVGLWLIPSFINHSCVPNVRRLHIGDYVIVLASREVKAGEEFTVGYYDVLSPLNKRKEMAKSWGFQCRCKRCKHEEQIQCKPEFGEIELGLEKEVDAGCTVFRLEECMRRCSIRGKDKGYLRASFWKAISKAYESEKTVRRWGRKIPALEPIVESLVDAVGSDERVVKVLVRKMKKFGGGFGEMERAIKLGRGVYGKVMKKQALRILLEFGVNE
ncbi:methyltransferase FGSG_00040 [Silene latifolia]|uniref:methyltransferase FGSG_00040 n=1 Tax=Silene latifolia TaxID=37657 RepID=UPI003D789465